MQQWLAAADRDHGRAHRAQPIDPLKHLFERNRLRKVVEFIAIGASKVAAPDRDDMRKQRVPRGDQPLHEHARFAQLAMRGQVFLPNFLSGYHGSK